jgi:hypothetical protein
MDDSPEQVEVKRIENSDEQVPVTSGLYGRLYNAFFPLIGGLILDFADLATFGPVGLYLGFIVGGIVGWLISGIYGFSKNAKILCTIIAGIYCTIPGTFFLPLATFIAAIARFRQNPRSNQKDSKQ